MAVSILNPEINEYLQRRLPERHSILKEMEAYAAENGFPIIGPQVGNLLALLARAIKATKIFELGSGFGYSAFWFCQAMGPEGKIVCTEGSEKNAERARHAFARAGMADQLTFEVGDARAIVRRYTETFDIVLIDIDKDQYPEALELALPRLRVGGLLITDNLLWSGRVIDVDPDAWTKGILDYTSTVMENANLITAIIPLRDGVGVSLKLG